MNLTNEMINQRVRREYDILRKLEHQHIVRYEAFDIKQMKNGIPVARLYMEYCEGGDLHLHVQSSRIRHLRSRHSARTDTNIAVTASTASSQGVHGGPEQPEALIWSTLIQLSSALAYCHYGIPYTQSEMSVAPNRADTKGICHRDLTPSNGKDVQTCLDVSN